MRIFYRSTKKNKGHAHPKKLSQVNITTSSSNFNKTPLVNQSLFWETLSATLTIMCSCFTVKKFLFSYFTLYN